MCIPKAYGSLFDEGINAIQFNVFMVHHANHYSILHQVGSYIGEL